MKISLNKLIIAYTLVLFYVLPINLDIKGTNFSLFWYMRLGVVLLYLAVVIASKNINIISLLLFLLFSIKYLLYGELSFEYIYIASSIGLVEYSNLFQCQKDNEKIIKIITDIFIIQIIVCTYLNGSIITSSYNDRNYTGFFVFLLFVINYYYNKRCWIILVTIGILTFSRLYFLSLCMFFIFEFIKKRKKIELFNGTRGLGIIYAIIQFLIIPISYIYQYFFKKINYVYEYITGLRRYGKILDGSNNIRTLSNIYAIETLSIRNILFGLKPGTFLGLSAFGNKRIYPHNTMLVIYVKFGAIVSFSYLYTLYKIIKRIYKETGFCCSLILYQMILGPSMYYGVELILINLVVNMIVDLKREIDNK